MTQEKNKQATGENTNAQQNHIDKVGETNVYPVSEMEGASDNAQVVPPKSFGQGDASGAESKKDSGTSEIDFTSSETSTGSDQQTAENVRRAGQ